MCPIVVAYVKTYNLVVSSIMGLTMTSVSVFRPIQPLNSRTVRTNIAFPGTSGAGAGNTFSKSDYSEVESQCPEAFREMYYQANSFTEPAVKSSP